jgi:hypothetical protein
MTMTTLPFHTPSFDDAGETERLDSPDHAIFRARARLHVEHAAYRRAPAPQPVEESFDAVLEAPSHASRPRAPMVPQTTSHAPTANGRLLGVGLIATACAIFAYAGVELYGAMRPAPVTFVESPRAPSPAPDPTPPRAPLVEVAAPAPAAVTPAAAPSVAPAVAAPSPARAHLEARRFAEALAAARTLDRGAARDALEAEIQAAWTAHVEKLPASGLADRARRDAALTQLVAAAPQHDGARTLANRVRAGYAAERARIAKRIPAWRRIEVRPVDAWGRVVELVLTSPMDTEMAEMMRLQPLLAPAAAHGELMGMAAAVTRDTTVEVRAAHTHVDGLKSTGRADATCLRRVREHADYTCIKFSDR